MLVVNQGISGQYHIFRGSAAQEFLGGLEIAGVSRVMVLLPAERRERGMFFLTKAGTFVLVLKAEDVKDDHAKLAFRHCLRQFTKQFQGAYGPA